MFRISRSLPVLLAFAACAPDAPVLQLELLPEVPHTTDELTISYQVQFGEVSEEPEIAWVRDGEDVGSLAGQQSAPASATARGQVWSARVTTADGLHTFKSIETTIANTAPTLEVQIDSEDADAGGAISAIATAEDVDGDDVIFSWSWTVDGVDAGIDGPTVPAGRAERGEQWQVTVVASDDADSSQPMTASLTVGNSAPGIDGVSILPAEPTVADTVSCEPGNWSDLDGDEAAYRYEWRINDVVASGEETLTSAFVKGDVITCTVTPYDTSADGEPFTATAEVINSVPIVTQVTLAPAAPNTGDDVTATAHAVDPDGDDVTFNYAWTVDGAAQAEQGPTLSGVAFPQEIAVVVTATDGEETSTPWPTEPLSVVNTLPTLASATISPEAIVAGDAVTCEAQGWFDLDGESQQVSFSWTLNGADAGTGGAFDGSGLVHGDILACAVTPFDGSGTGAPVTSLSVTVGNTAPTLEGVTLSGNTGQSGDSLVATPVGAHDADGEELTFITTWIVDGVEAGTGASFSAAGLTVDQEIYARVVVSDGTAESAPVSSETREIENSAPVIESFSVAPQSFDVSATLQASWNGTDADAHDITATFTWWVNDIQTDVSGAFFEVGAYAARGDSVRAEVTLSDGFDSSEAVSSGDFEVENAAPTMPQPVISPASPTPEDTISCGLEVPVTDADGDALNYHRSWIVYPLEGDEIYWDSTSNEDDVLGVPVLEGYQVSCRITADDGANYASSEPVSVDIVQGPGCSEGGCSVVTGDFDAWTLQQLTFADDALVLMSNVSGFVESGTFVVPDGVTEVTAYVLGAGGGGRGDYSYGGGGGGAAQRTFAVTPGQSIPFTVGVGGTGSTGWSSVQPVSGTDTTLTIGDVTLIGGGGGAGNANAGSGGSGGHGVGGSINLTGGFGGSSALGCGDDGPRAEGVCAGAGGSGPRNGGPDNHWMGGLACFPAGPGGFGPPQYPTSSPGDDGGYGSGGGSGGNYGGLGGTGGSGYVQFTWGTSEPSYVPTLGVAITDGAQSDTSDWTGIEAVEVTDDTTGGQIYYAVSFDDQWSFKVNVNGEWRSVLEAYSSNLSNVSVTNSDGRIWQYNSSENPADEEWSDCATNMPAACLQVAFGYGANQMDSARVEDLMASDWAGAGGFTPGTLDFAVGIETDEVHISPSMSTIRVIR